MSTEDEDEDEDVLPWNGEPDCPNCEKRVDVGDVIDGSEVRCRNCGATLNATAYMSAPGFPRGFFALTVQHVPMPPRPRDRRATRHRWARSGRR